MPTEHSVCALRLLMHETAFCCCERVGAVLLMRDTRERTPQLSVSLQA